MEIEPLSSIGKTNIPKWNVSFLNITATNWNLMQPFLQQVIGETLDFFSQRSVISNGIKVSSANGNYAQEPSIDRFLAQQTSKKLGEIVRDISVLWTWWLHWSSIHCKNSGNARVRRGLFPGKSCGWIFSLETHLLGEVIHLPQPERTSPIYDIETEDFKLLRVTIFVGKWQCVAALT